MHYILLMGGGSSAKEGSEQLPLLLRKGSDFLFVGSFKALGLGSSTELEIGPKANALSRPRSHSLNQAETNHLKILGFLLHRGRTQVPWLCGLCPV